MKRQYIQPITELVKINLGGSILGEGGGVDIVDDPKSNPPYAYTMDSNEGGFDDDDAWDLPKQSSLWDE